MRVPLFRSALPALVVLLFVQLIAPIASAQSDLPRRITAGVGGTLGDGGPAPALTVSGRFRVRPSLAVEADVSHIRTLEFGEYPSCPPDKICLAFVSVPFSLSGRATSVTTSVVWDLPVQFGTLRPYVTAGGGMVHLRRARNYRLFFDPSRSTEVDPLVSFGAGVDVPIARRLALGVDVRFQRVFGEAPFDRADLPHYLNLTRVGSALSYRF